MRKLQKSKKSKDARDIYIIILTKIVTKHILSNILNIDSCFIFNNIQQLITL